MGPETPFREPCGFRWGFAVRGPSQLQPLVSGPESGLQGLGLRPRPPSDGPGGKRKLGARGAEDASGVPAITLLPGGPEEAGGG